MKATPKMQPISILLADDHPVVREGLRAMLSRQKDMAVTCEAATGKEAVAKFIQHRPNVVLMDLRMPEMHGLEAIRILREIDDDARIIVLTTYYGDEDIYRALKAGAKGYLLKDVPSDELLGCIRAVHEGKNWVGPATAAKLAARVSGPEFTTREQEVLYWLVTGKSNKEIGNTLNIAEGTVKVHVSRVLKKLGITSRTEAAKEALRDLLAY